MFKGLIAAIEHVARNIACLESTMSDVRELLIEKKHRDGRRNRKPSTTTPAELETLTPKE
jgi:hypothetical protein